MLLIIIIPSHLQKKAYSRLSELTDIIIGNPSNTNWGWNPSAMAGHIL
jgi:hypothetical protein